MAEVRTDFIPLLPLNNGVVLPNMVVTIPLEREEAQAAVVIDDERPYVSDEESLPAVRSISNPRGDPSSGSSTPHVSETCTSVSRLGTRANSA